MSFGKTHRGIAMWRQDLAKGHNSVFYTLSEQRRSELIEQFDLTPHEAEHVRVFLPEQHVAFLEHVREAFRNEPTTKDKGHVTWIADPF